MLRDVKSTPVADTADKQNAAAAAAADATGSATTSLCDQCAALCCRYVALPLDNPETVNDYDNIRWYLLHENLVVFVEEGQWHLGIFTRCKHLQRDNRCGIYETRPRICREYTTDNCEYHAASFDYDHLFTSGEQLSDWYRKEFGRPLEKQPRKAKPKVKKLKNGRKLVSLPISN
ncbi:MAG: YkgJ family cysteine cluster protein [Phycisphaerae bacterium]